MKNEWVWLAVWASAATLVVISIHKAFAAKSPHAAGKCQGNTVPGYWADVL